MEEYTGVKFETVIEEGKLGDVSEFLELDKLLGKYLNPGKNEGNMSLRIGAGFLIKKAGSRMTSLAENDVVYVRKVENGTVYAVGGTPSSESIMHYEIYEKRKDAEIILHFHDNSLLEKAEWKTVGPFAYGSIELAKAVGAASEITDKIKIEMHGFVIIAKSRDRLVKILDAIF